MATTICRFEYVGPFQSAPRRGDTGRRGPTPSVIRNILITQTPDTMTRKTLAGWIYVIGLPTLLIGIVLWPGC